MPSCSTAKNPKGQTVTFTESNHSYISIIDGKEIKYTSGTGFIGKFFPPFDPDGTITARCAAKEGLTVEAIKAKWKAKGDQSSRYGTRVHECCEDIELDRPLRNQPENDKEAKAFKNAVTMAKKFRQSIDILGVEMIVFSPRLRIAGTIDLFAKSRKDGSYLIIDHKTNQSIDQENKWNKFALEPIQHVPDLNFWHYGCQLNLYQYLLKFEGYVPRNSAFKMYLNHITEDGAKLIQLPDMQTEIRDMFIYSLSDAQQLKKTV